MGDQQWQKGRLIGHGTFGSVYVGSNHETGAVCAIKEIKFLHHNPVLIAEHISQLAQETRDLGQLRHPNIVGYYGSEIVDDRLLCIYMEYAHHGSISKYLLEHGGIREPILRVFTRHIVSGLAYLHSVNVMHRDIKGSNLLIDASGIIKISDFGMAKHLAGLVGGNAVSSLKGALHWMAPELMEVVLQRGSDSGQSELTLAVDIWSLGCVVVEMFTGKPPWSEYENVAAIFKIMKTGSTPRIPESLSDKVPQTLLSEKPEREIICCNAARPSISEELVEHETFHEWFVSYVSDSMLIMYVCVL